MEQRAGKFIKPAVQRHGCDPVSLGRPEMLDMK